MAVTDFGTRYSYELSKHCSPHIQTKMSLQLSQHGLAQHILLHFLEIIPQRTMTSESLLLRPNKDLVIVTEKLVNFFDCLIFGGWNSAV